MNSEDEFRGWIQEWTQEWTQGWTQGWTQEWAQGFKVSKLGSIRVGLSDRRMEGLVD